MGVEEEVGPLRAPVAGKVRALVPELFAAVLVPAPGLVPVAALVALVPARSLVLFAAQRVLPVVVVE